MENQIKHLLKEHEGAIKRAIKLGNETGEMPTIKQITTEDIYKLKQRIQNIEYTIQIYNKINRPIPLYLFNDIVPLDYTNNGKCTICELPTQAKWKTNCYKCWKTHKIN